MTKQSFLQILSAMSASGRRPPLRAHRLLQRAPTRRRPLRRRPARLPRARRRLRPPFPRTRRCRRAITRKRSRTRSDRKRARADAAPSPAAAAEQLTPTPLPSPENWSHLHDAPTKPEHCQSPLSRSLLNEAPRRALDRLHGRDAGSLFPAACSADDTVSGCPVDRLSHWLTGLSPAARCPVEPILRNSIFGRFDLCSWKTIPTTPELPAIISEANELCAIFGASVRTARARGVS
jgi:hypothetical protein